MPDGSDGNMGSVTPKKRVPVSKEQLDEHRRRWRDQLPLAPSELDALIRWTHEREARADKSPPNVTECLLLRLLHYGSVHDDGTPVPSPASPLRLAEMEAGTLDQPCP